MMTMVRRGCGCLFGLVTLVVIGIGAVAAYPYVAPRVPQIERAVESGVRLIQQETSRPSPAPELPSGQIKWLRPSESSCQWSEGILGEDRALDLEAANSYPAWSTYYRTTAQWWAQAGTVVSGLCGSGPLPTSLECQTAMGHFRQAQADHLAAADGNTPASEPGTLAADRSWNLQWAGYYQRLTDVVAQTGCGTTGA